MRLTPLRSVALPSLLALTSACSTPIDSLEKSDRQSARTFNVQNVAPHFQNASRTSFLSDSSGFLEAVPTDLQEPSTEAGAKAKRRGPHASPSGSERLQARFPAQASGELDLRLSGAGDVWIHEKMTGATSESKAETSNGRLVYAATKPGLDRIYEVSSQRVEEYLQLHEASALEDLTYTIEVGPGIGEIRVDQAGTGLVAYDRSGRVVMKSPQPVGEDSAGRRVTGGFALTQSGDRSYTVRVVLEGDASKFDFPVLLDPSWVTAASMNAPRGLASATVLQNGKVLVAGGGSGSLFLPEAIASSELYDPATDTWEVVPPMASPRYWHTATLLSNGQVLVTGGRNASAASGQTGAEIFDPSSNTWSTVSPFSTARYLHSAAILPNGTVIIAGGEGSSYPTATEIFVPSTGMWIAGPPMLSYHSGATATVLLDNRVLLSGGFSYETSAPTSELYDPVSNSWSAGGPLVTKRYRHAATRLLNGKVLLSGGYADGGIELSSAELYDPASNSWSAAGSMSRSVINHGATLLPSGRVLVTGGSNTTNNTLTTYASVEVYDPQSNEWGSDATMQSHHGAHTASLLSSGKVLVAGGVGNTDTFLTSSELYDSTPFALGDPCASSLQCQSGFCVDGVCCDSACDGGELDCQACSTASGASVDGICGPTTGNSCTGAQCTQAGLCLSGTCQSGPPVVCTPGECQIGGSCDLVTGQCVFEQSPDGTACNNGLCENGVCTPQGTGGAGGAGGVGGAGGMAGTGGTNTSGTGGTNGTAGIGGAAGTSGTGASGGTSPGGAAGSGGAGGTETAGSGGTSGGGSESNLTPASNDSGCGCRMMALEDKSPRPATAVVGAIALGTVLWRRRRRAVIVA